MPSKEYIELAENNTRLEYWEQVGTKRRQCWLFCSLPRQGKQIYFYSQVIEYTQGQNIAEEIKVRKLRIAESIEYDQKVKG